MLPWLILKVNDVFNVLLKYQYNTHSKLKYTIQTIHAALGLILESRGDLGCDTDFAMYNCLYSSIYITLMLMVITYNVHIYSEHL